MTTINLHQNQQNNQSNFSGKISNNGFIFSLIILAVTLLVLVGVKLYVPFMENRISALDDTISVEKNKLVGLKSLEQVIDMQNRLKEIKTNLQITNNAVTRLEMTKIFDNLGGDLNKGVVVSEFNYDPEKITVSFEASNFNDLAKQILNFKKSSYFADVNVLSVSRGEKNIVCTVAMNVK